MTPLCTYDGTEQIGINYRVSGHTSRDAGESVPFFSLLSSMKTKIEKFCAETEHIYYEIFFSHKIK